jgi:hypothetical protein
MCNDSAAAHGSSPRDLAACSPLSSRSAFPDASSRRRPCCRDALPDVPPSTTGDSRPDLSQSSPYERKMDAEERAYRRSRSAQEQEQEQRYQQWQQERERERDPRYEWMR